MFTHIRSISIRNIIDTIYDHEYYALAPYMGSEKLAFETLAEGLCFRIERKKWHITWVGIVEW